MMKVKRYSILYPPRAKILTFTNYILEEACIISIIESNVATTFLYTLRVIKVKCFPAEAKIQSREEDDAGCVIPIIRLGSADSVPALGLIVC